MKERVCTAGISRREKDPIHESGTPQVILAGPLAIVNVRK